MSNDGLKVLLSQTLTYKWESLLKVLCGKIHCDSSRKKESGKLKIWPVSCFYRTLQGELLLCEGLICSNTVEVRGLRCQRISLYNSRTKAWNCSQPYSISVILKLLEIIACLIGFSVWYMLLTVHRWQYSDKLARSYVFCQVPSAWSTRWYHNRHVSWDGEPGLSETLAQLATAWYKVYCRIIGSPVVAAFLLPSRFLLCLFM